MTQRSRITPSGWLAIALAAYIVLFGLAYEFFRNRAKTEVPTSVTVDMNADLPASNSASLPTLNVGTNPTTGAVNLPSLASSSGTSATTTTSLDMGTYRAAIDFPSTGSVVQTPDGWVEARGRLHNTNLGERFFLVLESPSSNPPIVYPQQELMPSETGGWTARVRFGSSGQSYRTYIIATSDETAVAALFSHEALAGLPNGFEIVSNVSVNSVQ